MDLGHENGTQQWDGKGRDTEEKGGGGGGGGARRGSAGKQRGERSGCTRGTSHRTRTSTRARRERHVDTCRRTRGGRSLTHNTQAADETEADWRGETEARLVGHHLPIADDLWLAWQRHVRVLSLNELKILFCPNITQILV